MKEQNLKLRYRRLSLLLVTLAGIRREIFSRVAPLLKKLWRKKYRKM